MVRQLNSRPSGPLQPKGYRMWPKFPVIPTEAERSEA